MSTPQQSTPEEIQRPGIRGWLHRPGGPAKGAVALTHGAGSNRDAALLVAAAEAFAEAGYVVLRYDLPYRQARPKGPPSGSGARDREGVLAAAGYLREIVPGGPVYLAGQSYGGRQSSMVAAEHPEDVQGLLMLSYPLHPPGKPERLRTGHFPSIAAPLLFVHGTRDAFGSPEEIEQARALLGGPSAVRIIEGAGHGVPPASVREAPAWLESLVGHSGSTGRAAKRRRAADR